MKNQLALSLSFTLLVSGYLWAQPEEVEILKEKLRNGDHEEWYKQTETWNAPRPIMGSVDHQSIKKDRESGLITAHGLMRGVYIFNSESRNFEEEMSECSPTLIEPISKEILAIAEAKRLRLWNLETKEWEQELTGAEAPITCIQKLKENRLAAGDKDTIVHVWNLETGEHLRSMKHYWLYFGARKIISLPKDRLVVLAKNNMGVWNYENGEFQFPLAQVNIQLFRDIYNMSKLPGDVVVSHEEGDIINVWNLFNEDIKYRVRNVNTMIDNPSGPGAVIFYKDGSAKIVRGEGDTQVIKGLKEDVSNIIQITPNVFVIHYENGSIQVLDKTIVPVLTIRDVKVGQNTIIATGPYSFMYEQEDKTEYYGKSLGRVKVPTLVEQQLYSWGSSIKGDDKQGIDEELPALE